ncbi:peptide-methionine (S)-S-oxide reductase [Arboricoccus pini]|uniref:Peptide methionine sulfoxide reductase MsrA n=1 Tax=Arboricoccus pini TaxID=1963835 RepID=A0A212R2D1_9PROT|nr:peptide-methionine (S)-S-oxide reductase MsrA [Arboricoccus pini]SNB66106.1 peptide-methionine (S)-S-oxide reductase [Arboricoccus pini]
MVFGYRKKAEMVDAADALAGRPARPFKLSGRHAVSGHSIFAPYPEGMEQAIFGLGCFWGAERLLWNQPGVHVTSVGYAGGFTPNPTYEEVCTGQTGHAEVVHVVFDPKVISYEALLKIFFEAHDPTQGMRQGNDVGTQYRSLIQTFDQVQAETARSTMAAFDKALAEAGHERVTTTIEPAGEYWYAEEDHQQYLHKVPWGYCGLAGTGVTCPTGLIAAA